MKIGILGRIELLIIFPLLLLSSLSLSIIYSINPSLFLPHALFFLAGFVLFFIFSKIDYRFFKSLSFFFYFLSIFLLILTFFGPKVRGTTRWIEIFSLKFQPVEFIKPLLALSLSGVASFSPPKKLKEVLVYLLALFIPLILIFLQPDLGNAIIILSLGFGILIGAGLNFRYIFSFLLIGLLIAPFSWNLLKGYQKERIFSYLNPFLDPQGTGYNSIQAMIAVGSGGLFGRGLGRGTQSHLRFLPENHTDFIFSSLTEELGFVGAVLALSAFFILLFQILKISEKSESFFQRLFVLGIFVQLLSQVFINIGMNIGLVPITGVTLPLVSYGGSSLIATFLSLGIIVNIAKEKDLESPLVIK